MIEHADREEKNEGGQFAYLAGLWQAIRQNEPLTVTVAFDDAPPVELNTPSLVVANAAPKSTALAQGGDEPDMTDGKLDVTWLQAEQETPLFSLAELVFSNKQRKAASDNISHKKVSHITVSLPATQRYVIDGEVYEDNHLHIQTAPRSLSLLVDQSKFE